MTLPRSSCAARTVLKGAGQFFAIALYLAGVAGIVHYSVASHNVASESSLIELSQLILLAATVFTFRRVAKLSKPLHHAAGLMSAFFLVLMIRELDATLDIVMHGFWKFPALVVTGLAIWPTLRHWRETMTSLAHAVHARSSYGFNDRVSAITRVFPFIWYGRIMGTSDGRDVCARCEKHRGGKHRVSGVLSHLALGSGLPC
ncbi:hypothetical protein [Salinivibrio socompensis]|uniref:hypothetical protein n=1 Tax=Salinivibrio socompensis TaxID=1510206 RepID=UPI000FE14282|nr:hypothetical protein [Salinivibrio socompensis]